MGTNGQIRRAMIALTIIVWIVQIMEILMKVMDILQIQHAAIAVEGIEILKFGSPLFF